MNPLFDFIALRGVAINVIVSVLPEGIIILEEGVKSTPINE